MGLKKITGELSKRAARQREFIKDLCRMENNLIEQLRKSTEAIARQYRFGDLEEEDVWIADEIYDSRNTGNIKGKQAQ